MQWGYCSKYLKAQFKSGVQYPFYPKHIYMVCGPTAAQEVQWTSQLCCDNQGGEYIVHQAGLGL